MTLSADGVQSIHELIEGHPATKAARDQVLGLVEFLKRAATLSKDDLRVVREMGETAARQNWRIDELIGSVDVRSQSITAEKKGG